MRCFLCECGAPAEIAVGVGEELLAPHPDSGNAIQARCHLPVCASRLGVVTRPTGQGRSPTLAYLSDTALVSSHPAT